MRWFAIQISYYFLNSSSCTEIYHSWSQPIGRFHVKMNIFISLFGNWESKETFTYLKCKHFRKIKSIFTALPKEQENY